MLCVLCLVKAVMLAVSSRPVGLYDVAYASITCDRQVAYTVRAHAAGEGLPENPTLLYLCYCLCDRWPRCTGAELTDNAGGWRPSRHSSALLGLCGARLLSKPAMAGKLA